MVHTTKCKAALTLLVHVVFFSAITPHPCLHLYYCIAVSLTTYKNSTQRMATFASYIELMRFSLIRWHAILLFLQTLGRQSISNFIMLWLHEFTKSLLIVKVIFCMKSDTHFLLVRTNFLNVNSSHCIWEVEVLSSWQNDLIKTYMHTYIHTHAGTCTHTHRHNTHTYAYPYNKISQLGM